MKYLSLFSGIGGFELGIQQAYEDLSKTKSKQQGRISRDSPNSKQSFVARKQFTCIAYSEIDKYAIQIYEKHFNHKNYGDITKIRPDELPEFDFLCGGFPCQSFSIAGKRKGFEDTRGTLFFDIARILRAKRPARLLLENVKGLLSHDNGQTFRTIIATLDELGYDVQWQVLNSKNFGVPQNRERVFIVGHLRGTSRPEVFPIGQDDTANNELSGHIANTLTARYEGAQATGTYVGESELNAQKIGTFRTHKDGNGFRKLKAGISPTIPARAREDGSGQPIFMKNMKIRRLTPTECERLQGFPDEWTEKGINCSTECQCAIKDYPHFKSCEIIISDSQRYKCLGNAVTVNVIREIMKRLL